MAKMSPGRFRWRTNVQKLTLTAVTMLAVVALSPTASAQTDKQNGGQIGGMVQIDPNFKVDAAMLQKLGPVLSKMGSGYNSLTKQVLGEGGCVTGTIIPPEPGGMSSPFYQLEFVSSLDQFFRDTSVEAAVSGSFGSFSASVKSSFEQSQKSNSSSTHLLIREYVTTSEITLNRPRVKIGKALALLGAAKDPKNLDFFMRACGDQYVSKVDMGGEFIAILSADSSDEELKKAISIDASASYGSFNSSASFKDTVTSFSSKSNLSVTMTRIGGSGDLPVMSTAQGNASIDAILSYAAKFPSNASQFPAIFNVEAQPYIQAGANLPEPDEAKATLKKLQDNQDKLGSAIVNLRLAEKSYNLLGVPIQPGPNDIQHVVQKNLVAAQAEFAALSPIVQTCGKSFWVPHSCEAPARFLDDSYAAPATPRLIVQKLDTKSSQAVTVNLPVKMKVGLRGVYCFDGDNTSNCIPNATFQYFRGNQDVYVNMNGPGVGMRYPGGEAVSGPGDFTVQVHDEDGAYGDNSGDLYFVAYPAD
jgi:hypothetical protein